MIVFGGKCAEKQVSFGRAIVSLCSSAGKRGKTRYLRDSEEYMAGGITASFKTDNIDDPDFHIGDLQPFRFRDIFLNRCIHSQHIRCLALIHAHLVATLMYTAQSFRPVASSSSR